MTCGTAETLIARDADGLLDPAGLAELDAHVASCGRCRQMRAANEFVKRVLATRRAGAVPRDFAARVLARVDRARAGDWLSVVDWRRWTEWALPVAAALLLVAGYVGLANSSSPPAAAVDARSALESWALAPETSPATSALSADVSNDELLAAMLGTLEQKPAAGKVDER
jgi:anti-sigma factor RsiW